MTELYVTGVVIANGIPDSDGDVLSKKEILMNDIKDSEKLIITPHMAWGSVEARTRIVDAACENIRAFLNGDIRNRVDL